MWPASIADDGGEKIFRDVTADAGLDFAHFNGMSGALYYPEIFGPGVALFDYDADGDLDLYVVQGAMLGPGKTLDTERWFIVCANMPGSAHGSTGPRSLDPATGRPWGPDFPELSVADMVRAQGLLLDDLGVGRLHAVIGYSYGGYLTLQWGADVARRMARLVVVASGFKGRGSPAMVRDMAARFAT